MRTLLVAVVLLIVSAPAFAADQGTVAYLQGNLTLNGKPAAQGAAVHEGDALQTTAGSTADVVMKSGVRFRLYGNTSLQIPAESFQNPLKLLYGSLLSIVNKGRKFAVAGRTAVAGVRGTTFFVESAPDRRTYVCICKGKLHLTGADGSDKGDVASQHHAAFAVDDHSKSDEPMIDHTDAEIAELQAR